MIDDDDGEKQSAVFIAVRLISVERESVCVRKSVLAALCIFVRLDRSPMSHIIFFPSHRPLFLSREEKRTKNALKRERTSELIYKSRTFLSSSVVAFYHHP
jgi:hypothetical protein